MKKALLSIFTIVLTTIIFTSCTNYGEKVEFKNLEVYYKEGAVKEDAEKLGKFMEPLFQNHTETATIQVQKDGDAYVVRLVMKDDVEMDDNTIEMMKALQKEISSNVYDNGAVILHLCDSKLETKKEILWEE